MGITEEGPGAVQAPTLAANIPEVHTESEEVSADAYDRIADYAEEWEDLTRAGVRSDVIVARSRHSLDWYRKNVGPHVSVTSCAACGLIFNPRTRKGSSLTRCSGNCGSNDYLRRS